MSRWRRPARAIADGAALAGAPLPVLGMVSALVFLAPVPRGAAVARRAAGGAGRAAAHHLQQPPVLVGPGALHPAGDAAVPGAHRLRADGCGGAGQIRPASAHGRVRHRARHASAGRRASCAPASTCRGPARMPCGSPRKGASPIRAAAGAICGPASRIWRGACRRPPSCRSRWNTRSGTRAGRRRWRGSARPIGARPGAQRRGVDGAVLEAGARPQRWTRCAEEPRRATRRCSCRWCAAAPGSAASTTCSGAPAPGPPGAASTRATRRAPER